MSIARDMGCAVGFVMAYETMEKAAEALPAPGISGKWTPDMADLPKAPGQVQMPLKPVPTVGPTANRAADMMRANMNPGWKQRIQQGWKGIDPARQQNIIRMLMAGGIGGGLLGLLRSQTKPEEERPGFLGTMGSMLGYGALGAGLLGGGAYAWPQIKDLYNRYAHPTAPPDLSKPAVAPAARPPSAMPGKLPTPLILQK